MTSTRDHYFWRAFAVAGRIGACDPSKTIVIAGAPRSGTTALIEALSCLDGYKALNEPLLLERVQAAHGFGYRSYIPPGEAAPRQRAFMEQVLSGQAGPPPEFRWSFQSRPGLRRLYLHATRKKLAVNFCRINRMLHWFADEFPTRRIVLVVRHPCSVISSMLRFGAWNKSMETVRDMPNSPVNLEGLPAPVRARFQPILDDITTRIEQLALLWCLDYYIPFYESDRHPWILAPYERLVTRGDEELDRLTRALGVTVNPAVRQALRKPSSSARGLHANPEEQIAKWQTHLSREQIASILRVVERAGLSGLYGGEPEPDYAQLDHFQRPEHRWGAQPGSQTAAPSLASCCPR